MDIWIRPNCGKIIFVDFKFENIDSYTILVSIVKLSVDRGTDFGVIITVIKEIARRA